MTCNNPSCPDCHPEQWEEEEEEAKAWAWPYAVALLIALGILAFVMANGAPAP